MFFCMVTKYWSNFLLVEGQLVLVRTLKINFFLQNFFLYVSNVVINFGRTIWTITHSLNGSVSFLQECLSLLFCEQLRFLYFQEKLLNFILLKLIVLFFAVCVHLVDLHLRICHTSCLDYDVVEFYAKLRNQSLQSNN